MLFTPSKKQKQNKYIGEGNSSVLDVIRLVFNVVSNSFHYKEFTCKRKQQTIIKYHIVSLINYLFTDQWNCHPQFNFKSLLVFCTVLIENQTIRHIHTRTHTRTYKHLQMWQVSEARFWDWDHITRDVNDQLRMSFTILESYVN